MLTPDNIIDEVRANKVISFYALTPTEISRLEEISKHYGTSGITISPYMENNQIIDYKIILPNGDK